MPSLRCFTAVVAALNFLRSSSLRSSITHSELQFPEIHPPSIHGRPGEESKGEMMLGPMALRSEIDGAAARRPMPSEGVPLGVARDGGRLLPANPEESFKERNWEVCSCSSSRLLPSSRPVFASAKDWIKEMAEYVKSVEEKHLLTVGFKGFYGPTSPPEKLIAKLGE